MTYKESNMHLDIYSSNEPFRIRLLNTLRIRSFLKEGRMRMTVAAVLWMEVMNTSPEDLLALARSPMVKGKKLPAGGVVGNIPFVMRARQLVSKILQCGPDMTLDWEADLDLDDLEVTDLIAKDANLLCPECGGAI